MRTLTWLILIVLYFFSISNELAWLNFLVLAALNVHTILDLRSDNPEFTHKVLDMEERMKTIKSKLELVEKEI